MRDRAKFLLEYTCKVYPLFSRVCDRLLCDAMHNAWHNLPLRRRKNQAARSARLCLSLCSRTRGNSAPRRGERNRLPKSRVRQERAIRYNFTPLRPASGLFSFSKGIDSHIRKYGYNYAALCEGDISGRLRRCGCFDYKKLGCS